MNKFKNVILIILAILAIALSTLGILTKLNAKDYLKRDLIDQKRYQDIIDSYGRTLWNRINVINVNYENEKGVQIPGMYMKENGNYPYINDFINNTNYDKLNNKVKLYMTYLNVPKEQIKYNNSELEEIDTPDMLIDKKYFLRMYRKLFGIDKKIKYEDFKILKEDVTYNCKGIYKNVACYKEKKNSSIYFSKTEYYQLDKVYLEEKDIKIVVKYLHFDFDNNKIYGDKNKKILLFNEIKNLDNENQIPEYFKNAGKYLLTFKKDDNSNYYWYNTEYVK